MSAHTQDLGMEGITGHHSTLINTDDHHPDTIPTMDHESTTHAGVYYTERSFEIILGSSHERMAKEADRFASFKQQCLVEERKSLKLMVY